VQMGGDVRAHGADRRTPLHLAAVGGHIWLLLVEMGGDVHARTANGFTPLHEAAVGGHEETVRVLVEMERPTRTPDPSKGMRR
jgi:ankyrin repeat protein